MQISKVSNANFAHGNGNFAVRPANYADKDLNLRWRLKMKCLILRMEIEIENGKWRL